MISRFIFSLLADDIHKTIATPVVDYGRCYNRKQKRQECTVCRDICPKKAIVYGKQIRINPKLCSGCHLCCGVCPTQCISQQSSFIKGNNMTDEDTLMICCRQYGTGFAGINIPCIASLPWEFYAYSSYRAPISIATADCSQCKFGAEKYLQVIHERLQLFWGDAYSEKILRHTQASSARYSRREVLSFFIKKDEHPVGALAPENTDKEPVEHPSFYRKLLLNELDEHQMHGWLTWKIDQSCWGCQVCEKLCPCQAIQVVEENGLRMLSHNVLRCIGCQLCKITCPEKCIEEQVAHRGFKTDPFVLSPVQEKKF